MSLRGAVFAPKQSPVVTLLCVVGVLPVQIYREARQKREEKSLNLCDLRALGGSKTNHTQQGHYPVLTSRLKPT